MISWFAIYMCGLNLLGQSLIKEMKTGTKFFKNAPGKGLIDLQNKLNRSLKAEWNSRNSSPVFVGGRLTEKGFASSAGKSEDGKRFLAQNINLFGIKDPYSELDAVSEFTDNLKMTHVKYGQKINGIKIFGAELIVHFNNDGSIESVNGRYYPTPEIDLNPSLDSYSALAAAKRKLGKYKPDSQSAELIIYTGGNIFNLAYEVKLPSFGNPKMTLFVDAFNGSILKVDDGLRSDGPIVGTGIDLKGNEQTIHSYLSEGKYYLLDASLPMFTPPIDSLLGVIQTSDAKNDTSGSGYKSVELISDPNNDNNFNDNETLKSAVSAHDFTREVYEFYKSYFNRDSYDGNKGSILNVVHYKLKYNNAFWNGAFLTYGDGDSVNFSNLAGGFDVIVHEFTHGVTGSTADLIYENQSGALNESISDVFASIADSTDWLIGEDVTTPNIPGDGLRSMEDPHNGKPDGAIQAGWQPAHMSEFVNLPNNEDNDWGGVHINSGIPNKAFYNVASVIGHWKAGQIWYRSLTVYLTKNSQFNDLRTACLNSAKDLFGEGSAEYNAVTDGFNEVGLEGTSLTEIAYDDNNPDLNIYEQEGNWALAVRFTPPVTGAKINKVKVYISGDKGTGDGSASLAIYDGDGNNGLPGSIILNPYHFTPQQPGWIEFQITGSPDINNDFYVAVIYDGTNTPLIGADLPGNNRTYEYNPDTQQWYNLSQLFPEADYTLFMRAVMTTTTAVAEIDSKVPQEFHISYNYPNPFNPSTSIRYALPEAEHVKVTIYDINGREVTQLVDNYQSAGTYVVTWNGKNNSGSQVSSGIYMYRIQAGNFIETRKMTLLK